MKSLGEFLGLKRSDDFYGRVAEETAFEKVKAARDQHEDYKSILLLLLLLLSSSLFILLLYKGVVVSRDQQRLQVTFVLLLDFLLDFSARLLA